MDVRWAMSFLSRGGAVGADVDEGAGAGVDLVESWPMMEGLDSCHRLVRRLCCGWGMLLLGSELVGSSDDGPD